MQRKTNLFYVKGQDSNFLTFSNFTEALTGNFLSTDWKVYPSRFLCLYIPKLDPNSSTYEEGNKEKFIKENLVAYYENKLAFLRDYYTENLFNEQRELEKFDIEADINALAWLLHTIVKFDRNTEINFIGEVTEFDYNGTYTDTICIIDSSEGYYNDNSNKLAKWNIYHNDSSSGEEIPNILNGNAIDYSEIVYGDAENEPDTMHLYNWTTEELEYSEEYSSLSPLFDFRKSYYIYSEYGLKREESENETLRFNIIIPLFDITNINAETNFNSVDETFTLEENLYFKFFEYDDETGEMNPRYATLNEETGEYEINSEYIETDKAFRSINNPMGIWFADEMIELKRDKESKYAPSWSLTISSQFKPFPYSDAYLNNNISSNEDRQQAFQTFAKILANQVNTSSNLTNVINRLDVLEQIISRLNMLDTQEAEQRLSEAETHFENRIDTLVNTIPTIVYNQVERYIEEKLKWK